MYLLYNSVLSTESDFSVDSTDRAFQYGDGLFETIRYQNGRILFWPDHYNRLTKGMAALQLNLPDSFTSEALYDQLITLLIQNNLVETTARIKIQAWRQAGGLYTPSNCQANILITAHLGQPFALTDKERLSVYEAVRLSRSVFSPYKTTNALPYILAGLAKQEGGFDDMILLDTQGHVAECIASALFWFRNERLFVPALETGCIDGILRRQLIRLAPDADFRVEEGLFFPDELIRADAVFCGNVMGIQRFREVNNRAMDENVPLSDTVEQRILTLFGQLV